MIDAEASSAGALYRGYLVRLAAIGPVASLIGLAILGVSLPSAGAALAQAPPPRLEVTWSYKATYPGEGALDIVVESQYELEMMEHPREGYRGARACAGRADIPVRYTMLKDREPFCIRLRYLDGRLVRVEGHFGSTQLVLRHGAPRGNPAFPDATLSGPGAKGEVRAEFRRAYAFEAESAEEILGCIAWAPELRLAYADVRELHRMEKRWTFPLFPEGEDGCPGEMTVSIRAVGAVLLLTAPTQAALAQGRGDAPSAEDLLAVEDARFAAMFGADTVALASMLADDLIYVHSSGRVETKAQFLTAVGSGSIRYVSFVPVERRVLQVGASGAAITGRSNVRVISGGQELVVEVRHLGVYVRVGDRWLLRAWQTTRVTPPTGG